MAGLPLFAALWIGFFSLWLFALMGRDKRLAQIGARRVPEKRLFLLALLGGAIGGLAGMYVFHHKTKHLSFILGFRALALMQAAALMYVFVQFQ
jgi:uncharacterized membrane protein YsdA (DUF1294 family)